MAGLPYPARRLWARLVCPHPRLLWLSLRLLYVTFAGLYRLLGWPRLRWYRDYLEYFDSSQTNAFASAVTALDRLDRFRRGATTLGHRNSLEAVLCRSCFFDPLFARGRWERTDFSDPMQAPTLFLPGIPAQPTHPASSVEWTRVLEENFALIQAEITSLLETGSPGQEGQPWGMVYLYLEAEPQVENLSRCPKTWELLNSLGRADREHNGISTLVPGERVPIHAGLVNGSLRVILPIQLPQGSGLRVGGHAVPWREGRPVVFDDSYLHEAWNDSTQLRVILVLSTWHPELSAEEVEAAAEVLHSTRKLGRSEIWKMNTRAQVQAQRRAATR